MRFAIVLISLYTLGYIVFIKTHSFFFFFLLYELVETKLERNFLNEVQYNLI